MMNQPIVYSDGFIPKNSEEESNPYPLPTETCGYCGAEAEDDDNYGVNHPHRCENKNCDVAWEHLLQDCSACNTSWLVRPLQDKLANVEYDTPCNQWHLDQLKQEAKKRKQIGLALILFGLAMLILAGVIAAIVVVRLG